MPAAGATQVCDPHRMLHSASLETHEGKAEMEHHNKSGRVGRARALVDGRPTMTLE